MDEQIKRSINTLITERHGNILSEFRREHIGHKTLQEQIKQAEQNFKSTVSSEIWQKFSELFAMLILERTSENLYSYVNGLRDSVSLWQYFGGEFIDLDYIDLRSEIDKMKNDIERED